MTAKNKISHLTFLDSIESLNEFPFSEDFVKRFQNREFPVLELKSYMSVISMVIGSFSCDIIPNQKNFFGIEFKPKFCLITENLSALKNFQVFYSLGSSELCGSIFPLPNTEETMGLYCFQVDNPNELTEIIEPFLEKNIKPFGYDKKFFRFSEFRKQIQNISNLEDAKNVQMVWENFVLPAFFLISIQKILILKKA